MATKATETRILVDEFDFSGDTNSVSVNIEVSEQECTVLSSSGVAYQPILPTGSIEQSGYVTGLALTDELEAELKARLAAGTSYVAALFGVSTAACPAYVLDSTYGASMQIQAPVAGLLTLQGAWGRGSGIRRGIRVFSGTISATGAQTAVDLGAAGSNGGKAYLFVQSITGTATDADITVESSNAEAGIYADEGTFTFSAVGGYAVTLSGTVNRWVRINCDDLGGATSFTVVCIVAVAGVTY